MRRLLISLSLIVLVLIAVVWLTQHPGHVAIIWLGYKIDVSIAVLFIGFGVAAICLICLDRLWRFVRSLPTDMIGGWSASRRSQGYQSLIKSLVALSAGDGAEATNLIQQAEKKLGYSYPLTKLVRAQIGVVAQDKDVMREAYAMLAEDQETAFIGLRGLTDYALHIQEYQQASGFVEQALLLRPSSKWAMQMCLRLRAYQQQWEAAHAILKQLQKKQHVSSDTIVRQKAFLYYLEAEQLSQNSVLETAKKKAKLAYETYPRFVYGLKQYVQLLAQTGQASRIAKILEKHWCHNPHFMCYQLMSEYRHDLSHQAFLDYLRSLSQKMTAKCLSDRKNQIVVLLAEAQAALAAQQTDIVRSALQRLRDEYHYERVQTLKLWALLIYFETGQSQTETEIEAQTPILMQKTAQSDLTTTPLALSGQTSYAYLLGSIDHLDQLHWMCTTCHQLQSSWQVFCRFCHDFDSLSELDEPSPIANLQLVESEKICEE